MNRDFLSTAEKISFSFFLFLIERFCSLQNALAHIVLCRNDSRRVSVGVAVYNLCSRLEQALGIFYLVAIQNQHHAFLVANPHTSHISSMYFRHFFKVCGGVPSSGQLACPSGQTAVPDFAAAAADNVQTVLPGQ